jgi:hypothetical protein
VSKKTPTKLAAAPPPTVETKQYTDGTTVTGVPPLPDRSPAQQDADAILAAAASTAVPGAEPPEVERQPDTLATELAGAAEEPPPQVAAVYSLDAAMALPEIAGPAYVQFESDDPRAILAFRDADGRTMRVALDTNGLAKIHVNKEQQ